MQPEKNNPGIGAAAIFRFRNETLAAHQDAVAIEEPLEIRMEYGAATARETKSISVTMRTPGQDFELAVGFLFTEGIIQSASDILLPPVPTFNPNHVLVAVSPDKALDLEKLKRNFYTTSSCGVCGKESIESVRTVCPVYEDDTTMQVSSHTILGLPQTLRDQQSVFESTGGIHASALFDLQGNLLHLREDVGRHNALDKLIGASLLAQAQGLRLQDHILLLSGRASFELIQKAAMAGIRMVCAVGAPSSLAIEMAQGFGMTLVGFLREGRFNIYTGAARVLA